jgi:2-phospho-L-lactate guanylyltransferase
VSASILVPVKEHKNAKSRMLTILDADERALLAKTMFEDVADTLASLSNPVVIVTNSQEAAQQARKLGWRVLWETSQVSESTSVDAACAQLRQEGITSVLRLPADLPLVTSTDIEQILADAMPAPSTVLVPSGDLMGTNALLRTPPDLFPSRFGPNSFVLHLEEARRSKAQIRVTRNSNIALDLDDTSDLRCFLERPSNTRTYQLLQKLGTRERLDQRGSS